MVDPAFGTIEKTEFEVVAIEKVEPGSPRERNATIDIGLEPALSLDRGAEQPWKNRSRLRGRSLLLEKLEENRNNVAAGEPTTLGDKHAKDILTDAVGRIILDKALANVTNGTIPANHTKDQSINKLTK